MILPVTSRIARTGYASRDPDVTRAIIPYSECVPGDFDPTLEDMPEVCPGCAPGVPQVVLPEVCLRCARILFRARLMRAESQF